MATSPSRKTATSRKALAAADDKKLARRPVSTTTDNPDPAAVIQQADSPKISLEAEHQAATGVTQAEDEEMITVIVPQPYKLTLTAGSFKEYAAGTQEMPASHATHWWSRANGVTVYAGK